MFQFKSIKAENRISLYPNNYILVKAESKALIVPKHSTMRILKKNNMTARFASSDIIYDLVFSIKKPARFAYMSVIIHWSLQCTQTRIYVEYHFGKARCVTILIPYL